MCQKAFGGFFGALVTGCGVTWTRGAPSYFQSSNKIRRGFCAACGTPLTYEQIDGLPPGQVELAIGAFDDPTRVAAGHPGQPRRASCDFFDHLADAADRDGDRPTGRPSRRRIVSHQHPDHDTETWPPGRRHSK